MTIKIHNVIQGSHEWHKARCGVLTASEMDRIITPTKLQFAQNDKCRCHVFELLAQRITGHVEPSYISDAMLRGQEDEQAARDLYSDEYAPVEEVGFITNDKWGFTLGCSPDGIVNANGYKGGIEVKSRCQKYQAQTIVQNEVPQEFMLQIQASLLVTEREWWDFISYCGGMPLFVKRVLPDKAMQEAIIAAAAAFEAQVNSFKGDYETNAKNLILTERKDRLEITI